MKSIFSMGFFSNEVFHSGRPYLGQVTLDLNSYLSSLNNAISQFGSVNAWVAANPNYQGQLGMNAQNFANYYSQAQADSVTAGNVQATLQGSDPSQPQVQISQDDKNTTDAFISEVGSLVGMIQNAVPAGSPSAVSPANPAGGLQTPAQAASNPSGIPGLVNSLLPGAKPAVKPVVPAAPAISTPLLVGGGILGIGLIVLLVKG